MRRLRTNVLGLCWRGLKACGLAVGLALVASSASAQTPPANDNSTNAQVLASASGSVMGTLAGATTEDMDTNLWTTIGFTNWWGGGVGGNSVWYVWTAPASGYVNFDTEGSACPTLLG